MRIIYFLSLDWTDDEDESNLPSSPVFSFQSKRFRSAHLDSDADMTEREKYITRASGLTPRISNLEVQPWEFNFRNCRKMDQLNTELPSTSTFLQDQRQKGGLF